MISLENKKLEWLIKHEKNDEVLNSFKSQITYMKQLPPTEKLFLSYSSVLNLCGRRDQYNTK